MKRIVVSKEPGADFASLQAAIDSLSPGGGEIFLKNGVYEEKIFVRVPNITLIGQDREQTVITYGDNAQMLDETGAAYGTFRSQTFYVGAKDFTARNIRFVNSAGPGALVGQALALYVDADRAAFFSCDFHGHQDTIFLSPLPSAPIIPGSFKKIAGERNPSALHRSYFENCGVRGDVDFIFGGGVAYFEGCDIFSNDRSQPVNGYITAASTPEGFPHGFVFSRCALRADCAPASVYLGRPWRNFAKTVFLYCRMGAHIHLAGWHNWDKPESESTTFYAEYASRGEGGDVQARVPWARGLSPHQAAKFTPGNVLCGPDGWDPLRLR